MRMRRYLRECTADYGQMVTLTYGTEYPRDGAEVKYHLRRFLEECKREHGRERARRETAHATDSPNVHFLREDKKLIAAFSAFWFLEFQDRGAPHFHIFCTWAPSKEWIAKRWAGILKDDTGRVEKAGTRVEYLRKGRGGTISYAMKYAAKQGQKECPEQFKNVGRFWGICGERSTMAASTFIQPLEGSETTPKSLAKIMEETNKLIRDGRAKVIKRKAGVSLVVVLLDRWAQIRMLRYVAEAIAAGNGPYLDLFIDADIWP